MLKLNLTINKQNSLIFRGQLQLPIKKGGFGLPQIKTIAPAAFLASSLQTKNLQSKLDISKSNLVDQELSNNAQKSLDVINFYATQAGCSLLLYKDLMENTKIVQAKATQIIYDGIFAKLKDVVNISNR